MKTKRNLIQVCLLCAVVLQSDTSGAQTLQTLCCFNGSNGNEPVAALTLGNDGNFYGTTAQGGITGSGFPYGHGTIFKVTTNGTLTTLVSFNGTNGNDPSALTLGNDGNFYGTTWSGGNSTAGTVFQVTTNGTLTTLISFNVVNGMGINVNGAYPMAGLTLGNDGNFYGTTGQGGSGAAGTVFKMTTNGTLTTLASFNGTNGLQPEAGLTLGNDGNFYGTTEGGGTTNIYQGYGTVFKVTTNGTLTSLVSFNLTNGEWPAPLTLGNDGNLYGTTEGGGIGGQGTVFKVTTNGTLTTLVSFNITNGSGAYGALTLGNDGNFYGTTAAGGNINLNSGYGYGTVFQMTTNGTLTTLVSFNYSDGAQPEAGLTLDNDSNFYGTTAYGGSGGEGTVFRLVLPPIITVQPQNQFVLVSSNANFSVTASSPVPISYQWYWVPANNLGQQAGAYALSIAGFVYGAVVTNGGFGYGNVPNVSFVGGGGCYCVVSNGVVTSITVTNAGSGYSNLPTVVIDPPNGLLFGQTNSSFTITNANQNSLGNYFVVVSSSSGSVTSSVVNLTLLYPPSITVNPAGFTGTYHGSNSLTVLAAGTASLSYQWSLNGTNLAAATDSTYAIANLVLTNTGAYAVAVSNPYGSVTSSVANVYLAPTLTAPFDGAVALWGQNVPLGVGAVGSGTLSYQWYFNGAPIGGATGNNYLLGGIQFTNAGLYSVVVSSAYGSVTNTAYQVVVNPANVSLGLFAGVIIQGTVGYTYNIQASTDLSATNSWLTLTNLTLAAPVEIWNDNSSDVHNPSTPQKFYRVVPGQ